MEHPPLDNLAGFPGNVEEEERLKFSDGHEGNGGVAERLGQETPLSSGTIVSFGSNLPEPTREQKESFSTQAESLKTVSTTSAATGHLQILCVDTCKPSWLTIHEGLCKGRDKTED
ncbi:uncharacterized protein Fot_55624 [Forsythia ovata]|uniref:Uncharacterized protein n=1 Tax=Forsythia ovata TaxID=205694 RepID=A0ABD1P4K5_9LAMI